MHGGGLVASGAAGADRLPTPWAPAGLRLTGLEGAGEVQTPLTGHPAGAAGDRRPRVVPAREVRRAVRAHHHRAAARRRRVRRRGADLPRPRAGVLPWAPTAAVLLLELARSRPPTLGAGRLVCVDGPAGSGKTTLAAAVAALAPRRTLVHIDDLYDGWDGLPGVGRPARHAAAAAGPGRAGQLPPLRLARRPLRRDRRRRPGAPAGARGRRAPARPRTRDLATVARVGERAGRAAAARGLARDGAALAAHWRRGWSTRPPLRPLAGGRARRPRGRRERRRPAAPPRSLGWRPCSLPAATSSRSRRRLPRRGDRERRRAAAARARRAAAASTGSARTRCRPGGRGQLLMPWPNRIRDGAYAFGGRDLQLPLTEPKRHNASHGLVRWAAWSAGGAHRRRRCRWCYRLMAQTGYPWTLDLHVALRPLRRRADRHPDRHQPGAPSPRRTPAARTPTSRSAPARSTPGS